MTNNFNTIKENQSQSRFNLVRLTPRRYVNDDLSSIGGGQYQMFFPYPVASVTRNNTLLTSVSSPTNSDEYNYNQSTKTLTIQATVDADNIIIVNYYIFYTGEIVRTINENPENSSTVLRDWEPRLITSPQMSFNIENTTEGILSITASSLQVINVDGEFQQYLSFNDSFYKCPVKIWLCLDSTDNIQKVFDGVVTGINLGSKNVTISFKDPLTYLNDPCFMGDNENEVYYGLTSFPNLDINSDNIAIRYFVGNATRYKLLTDTSISGLTDSKKLDQSSLYYAVNINYSDTISITTNREWGIGRVSGDGFLDFSFTPFNIDNSAGGYTRLDGTNEQVSKFKIGDTFIINQGGTDYYARTVFVDTSNNYLYVNKIAAISTGAIINANDCPSIMVTDEQGIDYYCLYGRDYTTSVVTTSGNNKYLSITFTNNFEANHSGLTNIEPSVNFIKFRIRPDVTNGKHGAVLNSILGHSGAVTNATSFNNADSNLPVNANFSIPFFDEEDYGTYLDYAQRILRSTFGYLSLNNNFEIEYHLFNTPNSTDEITTTEILDGSYTVEIGYEDMINGIIAYNPHYSSSEALKDNPSSTEVSLKAKYLHNINKTIQFVHVLEKIDTRLVTILAFRAERKANYLFDTSLTNIDNILGDDLKLNRDKLLGNISSQNVKILSLQKNTDSTKLITSDLYNI